MKPPVPALSIAPPPPHASAEASPLGGASVEGRTATRGGPPGWTAGEHFGWGLPLDRTTLAWLLAAFGGVGAAAWLAARDARLHAPRLSLLADASPVIQAHVAAAVLALVVGGVLLARPKGRTLHRRLGWTWVAAMAAVAGSSFFIHELNPGRFSWIHLLSGWTAIALPLGVVAIKRRKAAAHRRTMTGLYIGGLIIAGAFTFVPGRLLWRVFVG